MKPRGGKSSKRKGSAGEREAAKVLNRYLKAPLECRRVPGSGALSFRRDNMDDPHFAGDLQIRRDGRIVEYVEVKRAKPGAITIATMDRWRRHRRFLMCRQDRSEWVGSIWASALDLPRNFCVDYQHRKTRGVSILEVLAAIHASSLCVFWGSAIYMSARMLCELLLERHGDA
jgi:hypothetical protein